MATREEIREGIQLLYCTWCPSDCQDLTKEEKLGCLASGGFVDDAFPYLSERGVVIKVDRDLVNTTRETEGIKSKLHKAVDAHINNETTFIELMRSIVEAGYVATEPLVEEK